MSSNINRELSEIQQKLKVAKNQFNNFGKYKYRSCEDILEAMKPLLGNNTITLTDDIVVVGEGQSSDNGTTTTYGQRFYIKSTATFRTVEGEISVSAFAREPATKKGMDTSQITGTASSYARKYALNGLLLIDDTKDADHDEPKVSSNEATIEKPTAKQNTIPTKMCTIHNIAMFERTNKTTRHKFFSHRVGEAWCNGEKVRPPKKVEPKAEFPDDNESVDVDKIDKELA